MSNELAWCAGFLDGEGSFIITKTAGIQPRLKPFISCDQAVTSVPLERLRLNLGGAIHQRPRPTVTGKTVWHWQISGRVMIVDAIALLLPHLVVKDRDAAILAAFCSFIPSRGCHPTVEQRTKQLECLAAMRVLRQEGVTRGR